MQQRANLKVGERDVAKARTLIRAALQRARADNVRKPDRDDEEYQRQVKPRGPQ